MSDYVAKFAEKEFQPSDDDIKFAHAFECIADVLENVADSDAVALRLSTCRNAYLTVNAIFVDLAAFLGRGINPPLFSSVIWHMKNREWDKASIYLYGKYKQSDGNSIKPLLVAIDEKLDVWDSREKLDTLLREAISKVEKLVVRKELDVILFGDVKTSCSSPIAHEWDQKYYRLDSRTDIEIGEELEFLRKIAAKLKAAYSVVSTAYSYGSLQVAWVSNNSLNMKVNLPDNWAELVSVVKKNADYFNISTNSDANTYLFWVGDDGQTVKFPQEEPKDLDYVFDALLSKITSEVNEIAAELGKRFKPNLGIPPLPKPYKIDLRPETLKAELSRKELVLDGSFRGSGYDDIATIALVGCDIPESYYSEYWFANDECRQHVFQVSKNAIESAHSHGAKALIMPEYFLPRGQQIKDLQSLALKRNIILIGGLEGCCSSNGMLINEAIIYLPERKDKEYVQEKQWNSIYEPVIKGNGIVRVFRDTPIGNFAVIVCSDYLEVPMINAIAGFTGILHNVFVITRNPRHELFCQMALADSYRLYTHVVIVNSYPQNLPEQKAGIQTFVCTPARKAESRVLSPVNTAKIHQHDNALASEINIYNLSLKELRGAITEASSSNIITVPRCRNLKPNDH